MTRTFHIVIIIFSVTPIFTERIRTLVNTLLTFSFLIVLTSEIYILIKKNCTEGSPNTGIFDLVKNVLRVIIFFWLLLWHVATIGVSFFTQNLPFSFISPHSLALIDKWRLTLRILRMIAARVTRASINTILFLFTTFVNARGRSVASVWANKTLKQYTYEKFI